MKTKMLFLLLISAMLLAGCFGKAETKKMNPNKGTPKELVGAFIDNVYFDHGTYKQFVQFFAKNATINTEKEYNAFRHAKKPKDIFPTDYKNVESVLQHVKVKKADATHASVYWLNDPKNDKSDKALLVWTLVKEGKAWKLQ